MPKHNRQWDTKNSIGLQQVPLSRLTQRVGILQTCILEVPGSNLEQDIDYPD